MVDIVFFCNFISLKCLIKSLKKVLKTSRKSFERQPKFGTVCYVELNLLKISLLSIVNIFIIKEFKISHHINR